MIYMDNAATTRLCAESYQVMQRSFTEEYGNPSARYRFAAESMQQIEAARAKIARTLNVLPEEIYFTSGGTESDNWAIRGLSSANCSRGNHIITTKIEHHAVLNTCRYLQKKGFEVTYMDVDKDGRVNPKHIKQMIRPSTILISVMTANNEIGTIEPIEEIASIAEQENILFHTDAVQAYGHIPLNLGEMKISALSASGHKFYGPKGIGFLYLSQSVKADPLLFGGNQEYGMRPGTLNVPGILGIAEAADVTCRQMEASINKESKITDEIIDYIEREFPDAVINGSKVLRLPNNVSVSFKHIDGEMLLHLMDKDGIALSSKAACTSQSGEISHVIRAIGLTREYAKGTIRLSISKDTTREEARYVMERLKFNVERLKRMTPGA